MLAYMLRVKIPTGVVARPILRRVLTAGRLAAVTAPKEVGPCARHRDRSFGRSASSSVSLKLSGKPGAVHLLEIPVCPAGSCPYWQSRPHINVETRRRRWGSQLIAIPSPMGCDARTP